MLKLLKVLLFFSLFLAHLSWGELWQPEQKISLTISSPEDFFDHSLNEWHLRHDQINAYLANIAKESDRVTLESMGKSTESREQISAVITSKKNQQNLSQIIAQRSQFKNNPQDEKATPLIIWLAYSIHGDEPSGGHAALGVIYYLATSNEAWVKQLLNNAVVLVTPSQNPDGLDRFVTWVNAFKGQHLVADNHHLEHNPPWPSGRFNHYLADLNRDWLFLSHTETKGRVAFFHRWQPHFVGDFHEMKHHLNYFFQPGIAAATHPLINKTNQRLTNKMADFHRQVLDDHKQAYFSKEVFDDFYFGKGSTYPDINGAIGVLFEQAGTVGQKRNTLAGVIDFKTAIENHFTTSISSLKAAIGLKLELIDYQRQFYQITAETKRKNNKGFLVKSPHDSGKLVAFSQLLKQHQIKFLYLSKPIKQGQELFSPQDSLFIPRYQPQQQLVSALFEVRTEFKHTQFYDVSSVNLQLAYGLTRSKSIAVSSKILTAIAPNFMPKPLALTKDSVAVLIDWRHSDAAPLLQSLLNRGVVIKFATKVFTINTEQDGLQILPAGSLMVDLRQFNENQTISTERLISLTQQFNATVYSTSSYTSYKGSDLGSASFTFIFQVKPLLIAGNGTNATEVGEIWYYLDTVLGIKVPLVNIDQLNDVNLSNYSHVIFADGYYSRVSHYFVEKLTAFVNEGGHIIGQKRALAWLNQQGLLQTQVNTKGDFSQLFDTQYLKFKDKANLQAQQSIGGVMLSLDVDDTHPLSFGLSNHVVGVMKNNVISLETTKSPFINVANYGEPVVLSGYLAKEYQQIFVNSPAIIAEPKGKGSVIAMTDNLLFRNTWFSTQKIFANALYFSSAMH